MATVTFVFLSLMIFEQEVFAEIMPFFLSFIAIIIVFIIGNFFWAKLTYNNYKYELGEHEFKKESGVIMKKYVNISYDQIQNIREFRGVLDRILGLADINIYTAGSGSPGGGGRYGSSGEGYLPGLSRETADELREELSRRSRAARGRQRY